MKIVQMGPLSTFKQRATHLALGLGLAATLAFGAVMPAMASDGVVILEAGASSLTVGNLAFNGGVAVPLTGTAQTVTAPVLITVVDATGSAEGWTVSMSASPFEGVTPTNILVANPRVTASSAVSAGVTNTITDYSTGGGIAINGTNVIVGAPAGETSNGTHTVTPTVTISIPANATLDTYTSTFEVSFISGPTLP